MSYSSEPTTVARALGAVGSMRRAVVGVLVAFALNGAFVGAFVASLPGLRDRWEIDDRGVSLLLVTSGVVAVTTMQLGGRWADRVGARVPTLVGPPVMAVGLVILALAPTYAVGLLGVGVFGAGNGCMDVSMNTLAVDVERRRGRPVMSRFHAFFSIGSALGGAVAWLVATAGVPDDQHVLVSVVAVVVAGLAVLVAVLPSMPQSAPVVHDAAGERVPLPRATWLLGAMAVCFGLTEGTGFDWSAIHVTDVANVDRGTGALGVVFVSVFMVAIRLVGDHAVERFGHRRVVGVGSAIAVVGYVFAVVATALPAVLVGWSLVGLGVGMIAPQIYGTAGRLGGGRVMGVVVGFGYTAFLSGPAIIGAVSHEVGIARAMLVPLGTGIALVIMSRWMPSAEHRDVDGDLPRAALPETEA